MPKITLTIKYIVFVMVILFVVVMVLVSFFFIWVLYNVVIIVVTYIPSFRNNVFNQNSLFIIAFFGGGTTSGKINGPCDLLT